MTIAWIIIGLSLKEWSGWACVAYFALTCWYMVPRTTNKLADFFEAFANMVALKVVELIDDREARKRKSDLYDDDAA